jgi:hypothetical protein
VCSYLEDWCKMNLIQNFERIFLLFLLSIAMLTSSAAADPTNKELSFGDLWNSSPSLESVIKLGQRATASEKYIIAEYIKLSSLRTNNRRSALAWSVFFLTQAASLGHPEAQWALSKDYDSGMFGVEENDRLAEIWYHEARKNGYEHAQNPDRIFQSPRKMSCQVETETVTGLNQLSKSLGSSTFKIFFDYENMKIENAEGKVNTFKCDFSLMPKPSFAMFSSCTIDEEIFKSVPEFYLFSSNKNPTHIGGKSEHSFYNTRGFANLVTVRQGVCHDYQ